MYYIECCIKGLVVLMLMYSLFPKITGSHERLENVNNIAEMVRNRDVVIKNC